MKLQVGDVDAHKAVVTLDGVVLPYCVYADEETGEAVCYALDMEGEPRIDASGGAFERTVLHGSVKITIK